MRSQLNFDDLTARSAFIGAIAQATLDDLFRCAALRAPTNFALIDAPNRGTFADGTPRYVTYAAADRMVSAIAGRLHQLGLQRNTVVGLQFPNMAEGVLALLGVLRAGMIAAPLPPLWRRAEAIISLGRIGAKAIIAGGRIGSDHLCEVALQTAAELFSVRYVCGFGANLPDGVIGLDELFTADRLEPVAQTARTGNPAGDIALVTWDVTCDATSGTPSDKAAQGHVPVARHHSELVAGGMAVLLEGKIDEGARILAAQNFASFSGLASTVVPWLLSGGTLLLHHAFDPEALDAQCAEHGCDCIVLPGPLVAPLCDTDLFARKDLRNVIAVWRSPERVAASPAWRNAGAGLVDVQAFGETGIIPARRPAAGQPETFAIGPVKVPRGTDGAVMSVEVSRSETGTLMLRGPMVPRDAFPPGSEKGEGACYKADAVGFVDTGYPCRIERETRALALTGPPAGTISVGGYRFAQRALQGLLGQAGRDTTLAALPDPFLSHRLAGRAIDRAAEQQRLIADGANALVVAAFRDRRRPQAA